MKGASLLLVLVAPALALGTQNTLRVSLNPQTGLSINGTTGIIYEVQYATNLTHPAWQSLTFHFAQTNNSLVPGTMPSQTGACYYRVTPVSRTNMVFIKPGTFLFGSPTNEQDRFSDEGPQCNVTLTKGLLMSVYLVTQQEYQLVTGTNPSSFTGNARLPVEQVSWNDASNYCRLLTQQEIAAGRIPSGCAFRLPTEAEWEYACRAGTTTRFYYGDDLSYLALTNHAWLDDNSDFETHPVGQMPANPWGLYDMEGNVWEWCQDWYAPYPGGSLTDPVATTPGDPLSPQRVLRGGSWINGQRFCRSACRIGDFPDANYYSSYGFRVVLAP